MILTTGNVVDYLVASGICAAEPRPGESWEVVERTRRNRNFSVVGPGGQGFFVKQARVLEAESLRMLQREATLYWLAANRECFASLSRLLPPCHRFDGKHRILVLGHRGDAGEALPEEAAQRLGAALARLHGLSVEACSAAAGLTFARQPPGILTAHRGGPLVRWLGEGQRALVREFAARAGRSAALDQLASGWSQRAVIHGDLRRDNLLLEESSAGARRRPGERRQARLLLVDWELVDLGDPGWDLGGALDLFLRQALPPLDGAGGSATPRGEPAAAALRQTLNAFWDAYCAAAAISNPERSALLRQAFRFAGARLLQSALEAQRGALQPADAANRLLELGRETLADPGGRARALGMAR